MADPITYELKHPIVQVFKSATDEREELITTVTLRRPTAGDMLILDQHQGMPIRMSLEMIAALSDLTFKQASKLDAEDLGPLADIAMPSASNGP